MTLEEAQNEILKLNDALKIKSGEIDTLNAQLATKDTDIQEKENTIKNNDETIENLRKYNNDLFLRVQQPIEPKKETKIEEKNKTVDEIAKLLSI